MWEGRQGVKQWEMGDEVKETDLKGQECGLAEAVPETNSPSKVITLPEKNMRDSLLGSATQF